MKLLTPLFMSLLMISVFSCQKDDDDCLSHEICTGFSDYTPLAIGNYWIYEVVSYNPTIFSGTIMPYCDTMQVIGISNIREHNYYEILSDTWGSSNIQKDTLYWRDSLGYIVDDAGRIQFSETDFNQVLHRDVPSPALDLFVEYAMLDSAIFELTPAGYFKCLDYRGTVWRDGIKDDRAIHNYFSKDVGLVYQSVFYLSGINELRRSLKEYHLE